MNPKSKPQKPFPWKCKHCYQLKVYSTILTSYDAEIRQEGQLHRFTVKNLIIPICRNCGEKVFTEDVDNQINLQIGNLI